MVDEGIDTGIDDLAEVWFDGVDNDGDGEIDELDEWGSSWTDRIGSTAPGYGFGEYEYTADGQLVFDTNGDGIFDADDPAPNGDITLSFTDITDQSATIQYDSNVDVFGYQFRLNGVTLTGAHHTFDLNSFNASTGMVFGVG